MSECPDGSRLSFLAGVIPARGKRWASPGSSGEDRRVTARPEPLPSWLVPRSTGIKIRSLPTPRLVSHRLGHPGWVRGCKNVSKGLRVRCFETVVSLILSVQRARLSGVGERQWRRHRTGSSQDIWSMTRGAPRSMPRSPEAGPCILRPHSLPCRRDGTNGKSLGLSP